MHSGQKVFLGLLNLGMIMERMERMAASTASMRKPKKTVHYSAAVTDLGRAEFRNSGSQLSQNKNGKRLLPASYFGLESFLLLICLAASLLILPVILPPLPPPPFMLLLLPVGILGLLMVLAFLPSDVRGLTHGYVM